MKLERFAGNPILAPHPDHPWEDLAVFNPAAYYDAEKGEVLLLYRAAESHPDYKCYFGLAKSRDGYHFERVSDRPAMDISREGFDGATIQDPRIVKMGEWFYVTYACRHFPFGQFWVPGGRDRYVKPDVGEEFPRYLRLNATLTGLAMTRDFQHWIRAGWITNPLLDDRDAILFPEKVNGKFVLMHRPLEWVGPEYGTEHPCAWIAFSDDLLGFPFVRSRLLIKNKYPWEAAKLGINTPPIRTAHGWFTLYHAVGPDKFYRLGALLLDLEDPGIVRHRTPDWLMQPETDYEIEGFYRGVCFPCGTVVKDDTLFVYYGAGDKYCALATCRFSKLLDYLLQCPA
ncbi:glycosidase [Fontisphaera persica]|uniref:glycoside hydrolase family 130 protein n=1 Tax=Fontisphaera persica TaxID=2974023 RepID=UPI0024BF2915|nr:glycosidase [Fontisphaera persica]WCJ58366.1 glycosidase [Fontisphaera persica]